MAGEAEGNELLDLIGPGFTFGNIYYVDKERGRSGNTGLSSDAALATVLQAYDKITSGNHDIILLSAEGGHVLDDMLDLTKSRFHIVGTGMRHGAYMGQRSRLTLGVTTGSAIAAVKITGTGVTLNNLKISSADTLSTSLYALADGGEFTILRNCWLEKSTDLDQTGAAELLANGDTATYLGCTFGNHIYRPSVARQNVLFTRETIAGKVARAVTFEDCYMLGYPSATSFSHMRTANANDIERFVNLIRCRMLSKVGGSIADEAITIATALTEGGFFLDACLTNATNTATVSSGVFTNSPASNQDGSRVTEVT